MKPDGAATGHVDGGWWPRSLDPTTAFPELVSQALGVGPVGRIAYNLGFWGQAPRKQTADGRVIRYEGFHTVEPHAVTVVGTNARRVNLLVVPPRTPGGVARAVLRSAADPGSTATVTEILEGNGVLPRTGSPAGTAMAGAVKPIPERRWETEGGHVRDAARRAPAFPGPAR